jgi:hypothetical protein
MSRKTFHRIYTEDKCRATIVSVISKQFENFTLQRTTGYYRGRPALLPVKLYCGD